MNILILKILLAPIIITVCTLMARKYGHMVGGIIVGLPLTSGPVALILVLEHGGPFVKEFSAGIMLGIILVGFFDLAFAFASRHFHWTLCSLIGWTAYAVPAFFLNLIDLSVVLTFTFVIGSLILLIYFFPKGKEESKVLRAPKWDIPVRIGVVTGMIFLITYLSNHIGARFSGIIATFPVYSTIFGATTHFRYGAEASIKVLKGILIGSFSFAVFFLVIGTTITSFSISVSFSLAIAAALLLQLLRYKLGQVLKDKRILQSDSAAD